MDATAGRTTVDLLLKPSARAHQWLFWLHTAPLVLLPMAMREGPWMVALAFGIALSWVWLRRHPAFGFGPRALVRIIAHADGRWTLENPSRKALAAQLLGDSFVRPWLMVLNFRSEDGRRRTRIVLGDETTPEALRRLRVRLAQGPSESVAPEPQP